MRRISHLFAVLNLLVLLVPTGWASEANVVAPFLLNGLGGRAASLADCFTAGADGPFGTWYNPASLGKVNGFEAGLQYENLGLGTTHNVLTAAYPLETGSVALLLNSFNYGSLEKRDETGSLTGDSLSLSDTMLAAGYGLNLSKEYRAGINLGMYNSDLGSVRWTGVVADIGGLWEVDSQWSIGAVLKNLGTGYNGYSLPSVCRLGGAFHGLNQKLLVNGELDLPLATTPLEIGLGIEYQIWDWLAIRTGYKSTWQVDTSQQGLNLGLGFEWSSFGLDFSFMNRGDFGYRSSVTLIYNWAQAQVLINHAAVPIPPAIAYAPASEVVTNRAANPNAISQAEYHYKAGQEYIKYGRNIDAIIEYKAALSLRPNYPEAQKALAAATKKAETETKNEVDATKENKALVAEDNTMQKSIRKHYELGVAAYSEHEYNTAIKELQLVLELTTQHQEATTLLHKAKNALEKELTTLNIQAALAQQKGDIIQEINIYRKILDLDPKNTGVENKLRAARQSIPKLVDQLYKKGLDKYARGQLREALKAFEEILEIQPEHLKAKDAIATIKEKLIRTGE